MSKFGDLTTAVQSSNRREQLEGLRDYLVHELDSHRCNTCQNSVLRTGDTAALVLRLQKILDELATLPANDGKESPVDKLKEEVAGTAKGNVLPLGTKSAPRRRGGRRYS